MRWRWQLAMLLAAVGCDGPPEELVERPIKRIERGDRFVSDGFDVAGEQDATALEPFRIDSFGNEVGLGWYRGLDGALLIRDAPPVVYVRVGGVTVAMTGWQIDVGRVFLGRPDAVVPDGPVTWTVGLDGLAPWQDGDQLHVYSPGAAVWSPAALGAPAVGATAFDASVDYTALALPAIESNKGDRAWVSQLQRRPFGEREYLALVRGAELPAFDMAATPEVSVQVDLAGASERALDLDWRISEFDRVRLDEQDILFTTVHDLLLTTLPRGNDYGSYGASADLIFARWTDATVNDVAGAMPYGNPYPDDWTVIATLVSWYPVAFQLPGTARTTIWDAHWVRAPLADVNGVPVAPVLGPPLDATATLDGVVSWQPPAFGAADWYQLRVYGLYDEAGATVARLETTLYTDATEVRLPPGFVDPAAAAYTVQIGAVADGGVTRYQPLRRAIPCAYTTTMTPRVGL